MHIKYLNIIFLFFRKIINQKELEKYKDSIFYFIKFLFKLLEFLKKFQKDIIQSFIQFLRNYYIFLIETI
jgi:hypothetical protein